MWCKMLLRGTDICGKIVGIVGGASGARGLVGEVDSGDTHLTQGMPLNQKKQGLIAVALKRVAAMAEGALKGNSSSPSGVATTV